VWVSKFSAIEGWFMMFFKERHEKGCSLIAGLQINEMAVFTRLTDFD
jgi:hypothetical protein